MQVSLSPLVIARSSRHNCAAILRRCDEAIQTASAEAFLDCFAALAMTEQEFTAVAQTHAQQN
jgi:hypothetical protein